MLNSMSSVRLIGEIFPDWRQKSKPQRYGVVKSGSVDVALEKKSILRLDPAFTHVPAIRSMILTFSKRMGNLPTFETVESDLRG